MRAAGIDVADVGVRFVFDASGQPVTRAFARLRGRSGEAWGLRDVAFTAAPGEGIGLVGSNGAGKTTLLRVLAGVYEPDAGRVEIRGAAGSLLSLSAGLTPWLTGRENCLLLGVLAGMSRAESRAAAPAVHELSGLGDAFERPVTTYSQGMRARLGFAVIEHVAPEVLFLDEVHQALDHAFRSRVRAFARSVRERGGIVVAAGHDHAALAEICDRGVWMRDGRLVADGRLGTVVETYLGS